MQGTTGKQTLTRLVTDVGSDEVARYLRQLHPPEAADLMTAVCLGLARGKDPKPIGVLVDAALTALASGPSLLCLLDFWHRAWARRKPLLTDVLAQREDSLLRLVGDSRLFQCVDVAANLAANVAWLRRTNHTFRKLLGEPRVPDVVIHAGATLYYRLGDRWIKEAVETLEARSIGGAYQSMIVFATGGQLVGTLKTHTHPPLLTGYRFDRYWSADEAAFGVLLATTDLSVLDGGDYQVHFLLQGRERRQLREFMIRGFIPPQRFQCFQAAKPQLTTARTHVEELIREFHDRQTVHRERLKEMYSADHLNNLRASGRLPRVLFLTSRHTSYMQYGSRDLAIGFSKLGCKTLVVKERYDQGLGCNTEWLTRLLVKWRPDVLVSLSNFRKGVVSEVLKEIPFISWLQDPPTSLGPPGSLEPNDLVYGSSKWLIKELRQWAPVLKDREIGLQPATATGDVYHPLTDCPKRYDLSYISHLHLIPETHSWFCPELKTYTPRERMLHEALNRIREMGWRRYLPLTDNPDTRKTFLEDLPGYSELSPEETGSEKFKWLIWMELSLLTSKVQVIGALIDAGFTNLILGGKGWDRIPRFAPYAAGVIANGEALNRVYNETRININISPFMSFHQKFAEVVLGGGFVLSPDNGSWDMQRLDDFFIPDEEVVLYTDNTSLVRKVGYYLDRPQERERIAGAAGKRLEREFSTTAAAAKMLTRVLGYPVTQIQ